jgi:hypothetical protein
MGAAGRLLCALALIFLLGACSTLRFSYNNAETALRYMAWDYFDADSEQADALQEQFVRLRSWHRSNQLPGYALTLSSAKERFENGAKRADVEWAIVVIRNHFRLVATRAAHDAAPVLMTLRPEQIASLEKKFSRENRRYVGQWIEGDAKSRTRRRIERMVDQFEDWTGNLTRGQKSLVERFVNSNPDEFERRIGERQRWQGEVLSLLKRQKNLPEFSSSLARLFAEPESGRSREYLMYMNSWESDLAGLIVDLNATLDAGQRAHVLSRLERYREDFLALSGSLAAN